jgi:hypothetical protein
MCSPVVFTVEALNQQIRSNVRVLYHGFKTSQRQIIVQGQIGEIKPTQYRLHYGVRLKGENGQAVSLDLDKDLVARSGVEAGDYVEVIGVLSVDEGQHQTSKVDIRIAVSSIRHVNRMPEFERE